MYSNIKADTTSYKVVMSEDDQYTIWPAFKQSPPGWREVGKEGSQEECLAHIQSLWTDMRPRRLREKMAHHQIN